MKRIIIDLDSTICFSDGDYVNAVPNLPVLEKLREYRSLGFEIVIHTSRNMRTYNGNIGKINVHTLPKIIEWLNDNHVEFDEVVVGKPWCGYEGFYVDDKSLRPDEFAKMTPTEVAILVGNKTEK